MEYGFGLELAAGGLVLDYGVGVVGYGWSGMVGLVWLGLIGSGLDMDWIDMVDMVWLVMDMVALALDMVMGWISQQQQSASSLDVRACGAGALLVSYLIRSAPLTERSDI
ncbi:hypothetical protein WMY93_014369 [Mugilogobius chulae]|uniref:NADH dehydrogenase subunit 6 n=1 Tax=Mugilogobius chulae TaxID=88201 RepID=A0AAW0P0X1_9GOBI